MLNGKTTILEDNLNNAFELGYTNASSSLALMIGDKVNYQTHYYASHLIDSLHVPDLNPQDQKNGDEFILITTEIFGDVFGKSYLFLSPEDYAALTKNINQPKDSKINFHQEFLKEVDNILSASVISKLSNQLKMKMYGDIPIWAGTVSGNIADIIKSDFQARTDEIYLNTIFFNLDKAPSAKPLFIWVIDRKETEKLKENTVL